MRKFVVTANNGEYNHCLGCFDNYYEAVGHAYCDVRDYMQGEDATVDHPWRDDVVLVEDGVIDRAYDAHMHWLVECNGHFDYEVYLYKFDTDEEDGGSNEPV